MLDYRFSSIRAAVPDVGAESLQHAPVWRGQVRGFSPRVSRRFHIELARATNAYAVSTPPSRGWGGVEPTNEEWIAARDARHLLSTAPSTIS